ncbi:MAG: response regulator transcription factor [Verrucomicrobiae bacterium]|nr:response regulator transcription factor [Verrucomicrobiae bacterium]
MRILIADDDATARLLLERTLVKWGHEVQICCDGTEAAAALRQPDCPRLAILDWMMPGHSGVELCQMIRRRKETAGMYVFIFSARARKEDIIEGINAGADDYLTKPLDLAELQARLRTAERILRLHAELEEYVNELESALRRHNLLGEILGRVTRGPSKSAAPSETTGCDPDCLFRASGCMLPVLRDVFEPLGIQLNGGPAASASPAIPTGTLVAWSTLLSLNQNREVTLMFQASEAAAEQLRRTVLGTKLSPSHAHVREVLAEVLNLATARLKVTLENQGHELTVAVPAKVYEGGRARDAFVLPPGMSLCRLVSEPPGLEFRAYQHPTPRLDVAVQRLNSAHVLADTIWSPDFPDVPLLTRGTWLQVRYQAKLLQKLPKTQPVAVLELSSLVQRLAEGSHPVGGAQVMETDHR